MPKFYFKIYPRKHDLEVRSGGLRFFFFYLVVVMASINTGNNLLYLVLSTLTAAILISWFMAGASLKGLKARVEIPDEIHAGEEVTVHFFVEKSNTLFAGQSLTFSLKSDGNPKMHLPFIDVLDKNKRERIQGIATYPHRGRHALKGLEVSSTFPFGIVKRTRTFPGPESVLIYPHIYPIEQIVRVGAEGIHAKDSIFRGLDGGLLNIRQFIPGDDPRNLHWKASARMDKLMVKEMSRHRGKTIFIHFNPLTTSSATTEDKQLFEAGVSVAASLAYHGHQDGLDMVLTAPGIRLSPAEKNSYVGDYMRYLAEVTLKRVSAVATSSSEIRRHDEFAVVIDPLNSGLDWSADAVVLDREYAKLKNIAEGEV